MTLVKLSFYCILKNVLLWRQRPYFSLFSAVNKILEKLVNIRFFDHLRKYGLFSDFQYVFKFPTSTADLLTFVADKFAVALDISEAFNFSKKTGKKKDWFAVQRQTSTFRCHKYA